MAHDVFVSYATPDKATADAAVSVLERHWIRCWVAPRDVLAGSPASWATQIDAAIKQSKLMVIVFSGHANRSQMVEREVNLAIDSALHIIPFRIEDIKPDGGLAFYISTMHWLDAYTVPLEAHLERLAETVKKNLPADALANNPRARATFEGAAELPVAPEPAPADVPRQDRPAAPMVEAGNHRAKWIAALGGLIYAATHYQGAKTSGAGTGAPTTVIASPAPARPIPGVPAKPEPVEVPQPARPVRNSEPEPPKLPTARPGTIAPSDKAAVAPPAPVAPFAAPEAATETPETVEASLGLTDRQRRDVQQALISEHFYIGVVDGQIGTATRPAIAEYQSSVGEARTGYLTGRQLSALIERARQANIEPPRLPAQPSPKSPTPPTRKPVSSLAVSPPLDTLRPAGFVLCVLPPDGSKRWLDPATCLQRVGTVYSDR